MSSLHHLLAITQEPEDPATRYRVILHIPPLQARAVKVVVTPWPREKRERQRLLAKVSEFDSVVVQRRLFTSGDTRILRKRARWLAYDFDDAVIYRDSFHGRPWLLPDRLIRFKRMVSECDAVTAGNPYLADLASRIGKGCPVKVVPTVIDVDRYDSNKENSGSPSSGLSIGWIGQHTTLPYLVALETPLQRLARRIPGFRLVTISDGHPGISGIATEAVQWEKESEVRMLSKIDVGLAPLADNRWTRGKCGLRLLQFLAAGIPTVASPVGTQREIADRGACISARSDGEWIASVEKLINDQILRQAFVRRGKELLQERFVASIWTDDLLSAWCGKEPPTGKKGDNN